MVTGQQSALPEVSPPSLPPVHCTLEAGTVADCIQSISFLLKALSHLTDQQ